jgi:nucleoside-diphosphate kinase
MTGHTGCRKKSKSNDVNDNAERSLIIIKPDGVKKKIIGEIISRFEREGLSIEKLKMMKINHKLAHRHYNEHKDEKFFNTLIEYITSGPAVVMIIRGDNAITRARELMGPTDSRAAKEGTIRGDFGDDITINVIHGSDSRESAEREIKLFFDKELEIYN